FLGEPARHRLPVRSRKVVDPNGESGAHATVHCPVRERSMAVEDCEACARFCGLSFAMETRETSVVCKWHEVDRPAEGRPARGPDPLAPIAAIMSREVLCVTPEVGVDEIMTLLVEQCVGAVPVVDAQGRPVGIVSKSDLVRAERDAADTEESALSPREPS